MSELSARDRIRILSDTDNIELLFEDCVSSDPICWPNYKEQIKEKGFEKSGETEAVICAKTSINGRKCCVFAMEKNFLMGTFGTAVGTRISQLFELAAEEKLPVVGYSCSGGARMQEGLFALMQMAKISAAVKRHSNYGLPYISILTNPTTGGAAASFSMGADVVVAEPGAMVGFTGKRVINLVSHEEMKKDIQTAESYFAHGFIDSIVPVENQKKFVSEILEVFMGRKVNG